MIERLTVSNFRSLGQDVNVSLGQMTVFVGPNGSGKSNVADALRFMSDCVSLGLEGAITRRHGIAAVRRWSSGRPFSVRFHVEVRDVGFRAAYDFELKGDQSQDYRVKSEHIEVVVGCDAHRIELEENAPRPAITAGF